MPLDINYDWTKLKKETVVDTQIITKGADKTNLGTNKTNFGTIEINTPKNNYRAIISCTHKTTSKANIIIELWKLGYDNRRSICLGIKTQLMPFKNFETFKQKCITTIEPIICSDTMGYPTKDAQKLACEKVDDFLEDIKSISQNMKVNYDDLLRYAIRYMHKTKNITNE